MRIQHNIVAMNAYRNYTNNVSAMKKNLEKLSSGYKINRAGDDAAGLAISEKMRAQITGLQTAQKNAKDGISLIQTAEGALTEVHDMLNRMVTLATQSANGTYDNETDRVQLQKEVDQLRSEINRIADSSNFNGIKLLDGSLDGGVNVTASKFAFSDSTTLGNGLLPKVGTALAVNTILHNDGPEEPGGTSFSLDLHDVGYNQNNTNDDFVLKLADGSTGTGFTFTIAKKTDGTGIAWSSADIIDAIEKTINGDAVVINGVDYSTDITLKASDDNAVAGDGTIKLGATDQLFEVSKSTDGDDRLIFKQKSAPTSANETINGEMAVTVTGAIKEGTTQVAGAFNPGTQATKNVTFSGDVASASVNWTLPTGVNFGTAGINDGSTLVATIDGETFTVTLKSGTAPGAGAALGEVYYGTVNNVDADTTYKAIISALNDLIDDANTRGAAGSSDYKKIENLTVTSTPTNAAEQFSTYTATADVTPQTFDATVGNPADDTGLKTHTYNWQTTDPHNVTADDLERLASTQFQITSDMVVDGNYITIGNDRYTFTTDKSNEGKDGYVYINDNNGNTADVNTIAQRLADAAGKNKTYTVGAQAGKNVISLAEIEGQENFDLSTEEGILKSLGYGKASQGKGKSLTLQIGESADDYNKLAVNVRDMHTASLGIGDINIGTQEGAAEAIDKVKAAINMVSDVRGTLGATQNRLDHTINNLSVMTENIQDAESTIRDTDVAEEMMAYTKNNILIQSAQAMLAQANQLPQGVLQLLQ